MFAPPMEMTSTLAPFGWAGVGIVCAGLAAILVAVLRARHPRRESSNGTAAAPGDVPRGNRRAA